MKQKKTNTTILTALPAKRRMIFRSAELVVIVALLLTFWVILESKITWQLVVIVVSFLTIFAVVATLFSLLYLKNNAFFFTDTKIIAKAGITQVFEREIEYKDIVFYKKYLNIPDLLTKKQTANFVLYKIGTKKRGKKVLEKDHICSMYGVKNQNEITKILQDKDVCRLVKASQKTAIKKELKNEWKQIKKNQK